MRYARRPLRTCARHCGPPSQRWRCIVHPRIPPSLEINMCEVRAACPAHACASLWASLSPLTLPPHAPAHPAVAQARHNSSPPCTGRGSPACPELKLARLPPAAAPLCTGPAPSTCAFTTAPSPSMCFLFCPSPPLRPLHRPPLLSAPPPLLRVLRRFSLPLEISRVPARLRRLAPGPSRPS